MHRIIRTLTWLPRVMLRTRIRKMAFIGGAIAAIASAAFAFILVEGLGSGTGTSGAIQQGTQALTVTVSPIATPVYGGSVPVAFKVVNPSSQSVDVSSVTAKVASTSNASCLTSWFTITPGTLQYGTTTSPTTALGAVTFPATLQPTATATPNSEDMVMTPPAGSDWMLNFPTNTTTNQQACVGATVTVEADVS